MTSPIEIYHIPSFRSTRAVWMYYELAAVYGDRIPALKLHFMDRDTFRTEKPAEFLKLNPNGKVPVLRDDQMSMWDSTACCYYLLDRYDTEGVLGSKEHPRFRALLHQMSFYASGTIDNLAAVSSPVQRVLTDPRPGDNPAYLAQGAKAFNQLVGPILADLLSTPEQLYMWKEESQEGTFTALDVIVGYSLIGLLKKSHFLDDWPLLKDYALRMTNRDAYQKAIAEIL